VQDVYITSRAKKVEPKILNVLVADLAIKSPKYITDVASLMKLQKQGSLLC